MRTGVLLKPHSFRQAKEGKDCQLAEAAAVENTVEDHVFSKRRERHDLPETTGKESFCFKYGFLYLIVGSAMTGKGIDFENASERQQFQKARRGGVLFSLSLCHFI